MYKKTGMPYHVSLDLKNFLVEYGLTDFQIGWDDNMQFSVQKQFVILGKLQKVFLNCFFSLTTYDNFFPVKYVYILGIFQAKFSSFSPTLPLRKLPQTF